MGRDMKILLIVLVLFSLMLQAMQSEKGVDFPDPKKEQWFERLPECLKGVALTWGQQSDGKVYLVTLCFKRICIERYTEER